MRITTFLLLFSVVQVMAENSYSQNTRLSVNLKDVSIENVLDEIENQSEFYFLFNQKLVNVDRKVDIDVKNKKIKDILSGLFADENVNCLVLDRQILLSPKYMTERVNVTKDRQPQEIVVTGKVTDEDGNPLPGVTIIVKGTIQGTISNANGNYSLPDVSDNATLVFSFVGMKTQEITVAGRTNISVTMIEEFIGLEEVIAIGYGTMKRSDLTGSVTSIQHKNIKDMPIMSIDQTIQGLAAGVVVQQQTGQPGGATSIRIRGGNSINAGNEPLYVIDGFPIYNENLSSSGSTLSGIPAENALSSINPNDIVGIEILKDASATAIYGARAANGVIIITTRRGKAGVNNVDFDMYYGFQEATRTYDLMDAYQYGMFRNQQYERLGRPVTYTDSQLEEFKRTGGTNWQDEMLRAAPVQNYQLSVSGGNEKVQYAISGNYFDQEGIIINTYIDRLSMRANLDVQPNKWMKFGESFTFSHTTSNQIPSGGGRNGLQNKTIWSSVSFMNPCIPVYDENGEYTYDNTYPVGEEPGANNGNVPYGNPVAYANLVDSKNYSTRILGNIYGEVEFIEGLKLRIMGGSNIIHNKQNLYEPSTIRNGDRAPAGNAKIGTVQNIELLNENTLTYDTYLDDVHHITVLAGYTQQIFQSETFSGSNVEFATDELRHHNIQGGNLSGERFPGISSGYNDWSLSSGLFRGFYSYQDKYLFTVTGRYDGASRFGANNKWAFFPSTAFGWRVSEEPFMQDISFINYLKFRASWGQSGNQEIPTYRSLSAIGTGSYTIGDGIQTSFAPTRIGNPDLKWETTAQTNVGFDLGMFNSKLNITVDAYYKKTTDLLFDVPIAIESGYSSAFKNIGSMVNKGIEISVNAVMARGDFKWNINANWGLNRNNVLELQGEEIILIDPKINLLKAQNALLLAVDEPIGNFYGYEAIGIWQSQAEIDAASMGTSWLVGQRKFKDQNDDGLINGEDRVVLGNALPSFTGGINNTFSYKNFELSFLFNYSYGNDVANLTQLEFEFLNGRQNGNQETANRWMPDDVSLDRSLWTNSTNPNTNVPSLGENRLRELHSKFIEDGSFIRLRNLTFGYNLPVEKLKMNFLRRVRLYFSGQNLLLFTNYSGLDPEATIFANDNVRMGIDYCVYPTATTYIFGVNIGF